MHLPTHAVNMPHLQKDLQQDTEQSASALGLTKLEARELELFKNYLLEIEKAVDERVHSQTWGTKLT